MGDSLAPQHRSCPRSPSAARAATRSSAVPVRAMPRAVRRASSSASTCSSVRRVAAGLCRPMTRPSELDSGDQLAARRSARAVIGRIFGPGFSRIPDDSTAFGAARRFAGRLFEAPGHRRDAAAAESAGAGRGTSRRCAIGCLPASTSTSPRTARCCTSRCATGRTGRCSSMAATSCPTSTPRSITCATSATAAQRRVDGIHREQSPTSSTSASADPISARRWRRWR